MPQSTPADAPGRITERDELIETVAELASHDPSRGWLAAMCGIAARALDSAAAHAVRDTHQDAVVTIGVQGRAQVADGRLGGRWSSVVGAAGADWFLLNVGGDGARHVLVPRRDAVVDVHERPAGLPGAGIGDVTVAGFSVEHRTVVDPVILAAVAASAVVGSALGGWRRHVDQVRAQLSISYAGEEMGDAGAAEIARTASDLDASRLQIEMADLSGAVPYAQAIARARAATDRLMASSRHALDADDPVTTAWRDIHAGCRLAAGLM